MSELSDRQKQCLRWLHENEQTRSRWLQNGKPPRTNDIKKWDQIEISGPDGMIRIRTEDWAAIRPYVICMPNEHKMFGVSDDGRAIIEVSHD